MPLKAILYTTLFVTSGFWCNAQDRVEYKQVDSTTLFMEIIYPENLDHRKSYPAMVFFFGGGWNGGTIKQFEPHARYFSKKDMICFLVDYRVKTRNKTSPFESLKDAKSAIRYVRQHAKKFSVDPSRIVAAGGSAGGHLAAATAFVEKYNESTDDLSVSCKPDALVLYNPVIDNGPGGYGYDRVGEEYRFFSPLHNIKKEAPPTVIFLGSNDRLIPVETVKYYQKVMEKVGSTCELKIYQGEGHGFFNFKNRKNYEQTVKETEEFLLAAGFLNASVSPGN